MKVLAMNDVLGALQHLHDELATCEQWEAQGILTPYDGKDNLRPHTIKGWWQLWSGGICIALLSPENLAPLVASLKEGEAKP